MDENVWEFPSIRWLVFIIKFQEVHLSYLSRSNHSSRTEPNETLSCPSLRERNNAAQVHFFSKIPLDAIYFCWRARYIEDAQSELDEMPPLTLPVIFMRLKMEITYSRQETPWSIHNILSWLTYLHHNCNDQTYSFANHICTQDLQCSLSKLRYHNWIWDLYLYG